MRTYVIDGSAKGIAIGAGVVEILESGFIQNHTFQAFHTNASAITSEMFAFQMTLDTILKIEGKVPEKITIYTDNDAVYKYFWQEVAKKEKDEYINEIKRQVALLKKFTGFSVKKVDASVAATVKLAHHLSREYMNSSVCKYLFEQTEKNHTVEKQLQMAGKK